MQHRAQADGDPKAYFSKLDQQRKMIDALDKEILQLINRRLAAAQTIGKIKKQHRVDVFDQTREHQILQRLFELNTAGMLRRTDLMQIYTAIFAASRNIQNPGPGLRCGLSGPRIYALLGQPVDHSLSPVMHRAAFAMVDYHGVYFALSVKDIGQVLAALKAIDFKGASITVPHKVAVIEFLDGMDVMAEKIQAVNTIQNQDGRLIGYNTDCFGALRALTEKTAVRNKDVVIIGAGGAARAIGFGVKSEGGRLTIINRSAQKGEQLAASLDAEFRPLAEVNRLSCHILINATSVGMFPDQDAMPLSAALLKKEMIVMDIVYNPLKTKLLMQAAKIGCPTIDGIAMLVHQGAQQFELWTGQKAPLEIMRMSVLEALDEG